MIIPLANIDKQDLIIFKIVFPTTLIVQLVRGILWQIHPGLTPSWLPLSKIDKRTLADSTAVFLGILALLFLTARGHVQISQGQFADLSTVLFAIQAVLGGTLLVLSYRKTGTNLLIALVVLISVAVIFMTPFLLAGSVAYSMYYFMHLHGERDIEMLTVAAATPLLIAAVMLSIKDKRDRLINTKQVMITQLITLPGIPLVYFALKEFWPTQLSIYFVLLLLLAPTALFVLLKQIYGKQLPWLVKEKVEILQAEFDSKNAVSIDNEERVRRIQSIKEELEGQNLQLNNPLDFIDYADALWKLGSLQAFGAEYEDAKTSYLKAIQAYNSALKIDPKNGTAIKNKFKTVESLCELERLIRFKTNS